MGQENDVSIQGSMKEVQEAVEAIVAKARKKHEGIPDTVIVIGASGRGEVHGHFQPKSWKLKGGSKDELYGEIFLAGESLERGGEGTLGTVLHELVHAHCHAKGIKDTSNGNRYHNQKFKEVAEEFGLHLEKAQTIGWSVTTVPEATLDLYRSEVEQLDGAIRTHRLSFGALQDLGLEPETPKPMKRKMQCPECEEPLIVTKTWWEKQGNGGYSKKGDGIYTEGLGLLCKTHDMEYEIFEEGGDE